MQDVNRLGSEKKTGITVLFFVGLTAISTLLYIKNSGGVGIELPLNMLILTIIGCLFFYFSCKQTRISRPYYKNIFILLGIGALSLPWMMNIHASRGVILLLIAGLAWQYLAQQYINQHYRRFILWSVFLLALGQAVICAIQSFLPQLAGELYEYVWLRNSGRPYGIFQQVNVLASFLATGLGCGLLLLKVEKKISAHVFIMAGLAGLAFILGINQSRVGELGCGVILIAITAALRKEMPASRLFAAWAVILSTLLAGIWCANHVHFLINGQEYLLARQFASSNYNRWHVLKITLEMIAMKPWFGWGYGTFEHAFSRYVITHHELKFALTENFTHPHNELLYAWFQGGVVALAGMLLLFVGWIKIVIDGFRHSRSSGSYALLIVPFLLHLNTEYPFYQSFLHLAVFVLLLRIGVIDEFNPEQLKPRRAPLSGRIFYAAIGVALLVFGIAGMLAGQQLTQYERSGLMFYPTKIPWYFKTQDERAKFDAMVFQLMDYNQTFNVNSLKDFMRDAEEYSHHHNDKRVLVYMAIVAHKLGDDNQARQLRRLCMQLFPPSV